VAGLIETLEETFRVPVSPWLAWTVFGVIFACGFFVKRGLFGLLQRITARTPTHLDDLLVKRMRPAARLFLFVLAGRVALWLRGDPYPTLDKGLGIAEYLLVAYLVIEAAETLVFDWYFEEKRTTHIPEVLRQVILVLLYLGALLAILASHGFDVTPILATSTVASVVLGLALQDTLGNLFAGLSLHAELAFGVGDWILVDGIEGKVVNAGWRSTQLLTFTGDVVSIPNNLIAKSRHQNFYRPNKETGRNIDFLVRVDAAPVEVEAACAAAMASVPSCLATHARNKIWFVEMHPLYAKYVLRAWTGDFAIHDDMESDLRKALWSELRARRLDVPTLTPDGTALAAATTITGNAGG